MSNLGTLLVVVAALLLGGVALSLAGRWWIERQVPAMGHFIEVDGIRLHYVEAGSGPTLVLLHGASSNLRDLATSLLPELATDFRVIAFDRPGYGYSERPAGDEWPDPARIAKLVLDASARLGADRPVLVGHSWAGSVVMAALVEMPERLRGGVLLGGVAGHWAGPVDWTYAVGGLPVVGPVFAYTAVFPAGMMLMEPTVQRVVAPSAVPPGYISNIGARLALRPRSFLRNVQDMNRLSEYLQALSPRYDTIQLPLLLVHGEADELVPFWNHGRRLLPVVPRAQPVLIPGAGHALHHTHTDAVAVAIRRFASP